MISQPSNQQRVISFTLVSQHASAMWNWQVDRLRTIPSDCWCGQMCVWGCALACIRDRVGYTWCHLAVAPHTEHSPSLCVESEPPGSWIQITAHTNHHQRINTHHIKHQCTDASREHTNCSLRLSINLYIYIYIFLLFLSSSPFFFYTASILPQLAPPRPHPGDRWDQPVDAPKYPLRLQKTLKQRDNVALPRWKPQIDGRTSSDCSPHTMKSGQSDEWTESDWCLRMSCSLDPFKDVRKFTVVLGFKMRKHPVRNSFDIWQPVQKHVSKF